MSLFVKTIGDGPDVVLLHGWGLNSAVWNETVVQLAPYFRVTVMDLPGHGKSDLPTVFDLEHVTKSVLEFAPKNAIWIGWSLGGLVALNIAIRFPEYAQRLIMVTSNAQFVRNENWPYGMDEKIMRQFQATLEKDYQQTISRFIALQILGQPEARQTAKILKESLLTHGEPQLDALRGGMNILLNDSLVSRIGEIDIPILLINGRLDSLVPLSAGHQLAKRFKHAQLIVIDKTAHTPFLSHCDQFIAAVKKFITEGRVP